MDNYQIDSYSGAEIEALLGKIDDIGNASQSTAGLMSAADKTKLDGLDSGAQANVLEGVKIAGADLPITEKKVNIPADSSPTSGSNSLVRSGGVFNAIKDFITRSVNDLVNYYTKTEVNNIIGSLNQFHYEIYASTSAVTNPQPNVLYLIGPTGTGSDKYEEYVYSNGWVKIGDTTIDLSGYSTTEQMNAAINNALKDYATKEEVSQLGQYVDNLEWARVVTDNDGRILYGVKADGNFYFGAGCPSQVQEYVHNYVGTYGYNKDSIDVLLATKVDKVLGKSLIDTDFASSQSVIENAEFFNIETDSDGRILSARKADGTKIENLPMNIMGTEFSSIENSEFVKVAIDENKNIVYYVTKDGVIVGKFNNLLENEIDYFPKNKYLPLIASMARREISGNSGQQDDNYRNLVFASITDTHNNNKAIYNFLDFNKKYGIYVNDMIHIGDLVKTEFSDPFDHPGVTGFEKIMVCLGNHDAYVQNHSSFSDVESAADCYDRYFKGRIDNWGVKYTPNLCYYYKDYLCGIRYIVLDCMHWDSTQKTWLEDLLYNDEQNSALSLGLQVVIAQHVPVSGAVVSADYVAGMNFLKCTFNPKDNLSIYHTYNYDSLECVDEFQQRGGIFVSWIFGHWHVDGIGKYIEYPNQLFIVQASGGITREGGWSDTVRIDNTESENQFSIYSVDPYKKFIRILRVGAEYDRNLQHKGTLTIQYNPAIEIITNF